MIGTERHPPCCDLQGLCEGRELRYITTRYTKGRVMIYVVGSYLPIYIDLVWTLEDVPCQ